MRQRRVTRVVLFEGESLKHTINFSSSPSGPNAQVREWARGFRPNRPGSSGWQSPRAISAYAHHFAPWILASPNSSPPPQAPLAPPTTAPQVVYLQQPPQQQHFAQPQPQYVQAPPLQIMQPQQPQYTQQPPQPQSPSLSPGVAPPLMLDVVVQYEYWGARGGGRLNQHTPPGMHKAERKLRILVDDTRTAATIRDEVLTRKDIIPPPYGFLGVMMKSGTGFELGENDLIRYVSL